MEETHMADSGRLKKESEKNSDLSIENNPQKFKILKSFPIIAFFYITLWPHQKFNSVDVQSTYHNDGIIFSKYLFGFCVCVFVVVVVVVVVFLI